MQTRWNDARFKVRLESLVWTSSPIVRRYLHTLVSGRPDCDWVTYVTWRHLSSAADRALVLGCGSGWLERGLAQRNRFRSIVACDFAQQTVEKARAAAAEANFPGIEYRVLDLEHEDLGGPFDAVFAHDVLHHITDLEGLYARVDWALAPGGKFFFQEYVGPNRFQYSDDRMALINRYFRLFPDELRLDPLTGELLWRRERLSAEKVAQDDPTEAVRSQDVLPLARCVFRVESVYPGGGGLLNPLLFGVISNFRDGNQADEFLLQTLCDAEDRLTRSGRIRQDFAIFAGSSKTA
jgi:SAM-dependent methyltransferase